jgi:hypothetical protein
MFFWKSPFNKIVRSNEAGFVGVLIGIIIGIMLMLFVPTTISEKDFKKPLEICGSPDNIKTVYYMGTGKFSRVSCVEKK